MCATRLHVWCKEDARAPCQAGDKRRRVTESQGIAQGVFALIEIADRCARQCERFSARNAGLIRSLGHATVLAEVFQPRVDLELVIKVIDDFSVDAGAAFEPGGRNEAVIKLRPIHAVKLRRLVKKIDEAERHDIDTGRAPVEVLVKQEVDVGLFELYRASVRDPESFLLTSSGPPILDAELPLEDPQGWDIYWERGQEKSRRAYSFIASVYRRLVIRRNLNHFIHKHFSPGARLLHAGCGSGQVDAEVSREMRITAVDISLPALECYRRNNPSAETIRHGDILNLNDVPRGSFDGAYNLGVVEHFSQDQIVQILREMGRAVKAGGKVVIFWPHRRASSVFVLKLIHWVLNLFRRSSRSQVRLHPPEISLLGSRDQAREIVERAGFNLVEYYFGMRDLLVQAVVVGTKR